MSSRITALCALVALLLALPLSAHGGQYRGPGGTPLFPPNTGGPAPKGPSTKYSPTQTSDSTSWQHWWEFNKDAYLRLKQAVLDEGVVTGSDDFHMGGQGRRASSLAATELDKQDVVLPALKKLLDSSNNRDIVTGCMIALAKIGRNHADFQILPLFEKNLRRGDQEVRETAAVCLGIAQMKEALPSLIALALNKPAGRRMVDRSRVSDRTRAFACYGLGLIAAGNQSVDVKLAAFDALREVLTNPEVDSRDIRVAAVKAIGVLDLDVELAAHKRLLWTALPVLWEFYKKDLGKSMQVAQAHAPTSIAQLLGRGHSSDHQRFKAVFAAELQSKKKRHNSIYQSVALALGRLVEKQEDFAADAVFSKDLQSYYKKGKNQLARYMCLIALGEIGGFQNRDFLFSAMIKGTKALEKPWAAIALGLMVHKQRQLGAPDPLIGRKIHEYFIKVENPETRAAMAVALGLCGHNEAVVDMTKKMKKHKSQHFLVGYICMGFALMDAVEMTDTIRITVRDAVRKPMILTQGSIALGMLGDKNAMGLLNELLSEGSSSVVRLAAVATAYRYIGDRRAITSLVKLMDKDGLTRTSRAFVAAALGGIADKELMPWSMRFSSGSNYAARVPTLINGKNGILDIL